MIAATEDGMRSEADQGGRTQIPDSQTRAAVVPSSISLTLLPPAIRFFRRSLSSHFGSCVPAAAASILHFSSDLSPALHAAFL